VTKIEKEASSIKLKGESKKAKVSRKNKLSCSDVFSCE